MARYSQLTLLAALLAAVLFAAPAVFAQDQSPDSPAARGADLVAWSDMQTPEPVPQTAPRPEPVPDPNPETQPAQQPSSPSTPDQSTPAQPAPSGQAQTEPAAQTFSGTIAKDGDNYVLKVADTTSYQLDDQERAKAYVGQRVRVLGALDKDSNMIHVQKIEPLT